MSHLEPYVDTFGAAPGYLDWAAFGPLSPTVLSEMCADAELLGTGRRSGIELVGERIAEARGRLARLLGASADEVVLQPSTTHSLFQAMFGLSGTVVVPSQEFPAIRVSAHRAAAARGRLAVREIDPPEGIVTIDSIVEALTDDVTAIAVSVVDFRTGALLDLAGIRDAIGDRLLLVDAMQAFGVVDVDWTAADLVAGNGYTWLRAGRGTGFARFSARAQERIVPVLSGISGMVGDVSALGVPATLDSAAAFSIAPPDPLAASRLAAALRELEDVGVAVVAAELHERAEEIITLADRHEVPVLTPRDAHAGIVTLFPVAQDAAAFAATLANHGVTVTARGATIRVSPHVGTGADTVMMLGDALADAAARRASSVVETVPEDIVIEVLGDSHATEN
ncbi:aminotransferase class V-fold PLP-dependent enzyme [Microbacterium sp.]|uniref:aminotransferase class V-fold PLP-dependent enzyme n=1 Tax=Microbacterium sp. TaxID=51671 RepID=UPI0025EEDC5C|nr:aminotransferase class V-fold PLP-dependent enzyme [Microbacterium sp.]